MHSLYSTVGDFKCLIMITERNAEIIIILHYSQSFVACVAQTAV